MKTSEIIAAVENGAKWQYKSIVNGAWADHSVERNKTPLEGLCSFIGSGYAVRLTPQKKTVPLGPDDW